jgi:capsule polysaccharide export protein KpsE/RkpR
LNTADATLNLIHNLTAQLIELETRLASHRSIIDDENNIRRQLDDLNGLNNHLQTLEKSITELLIQSKQLDNQRLIRI